MEPSPQHPNLTNFHSDPAEKQGWKAVQYPWGLSKRAFILLCILLLTRLAMYIGVQSKHWRFLEKKPLFILNSVIGVPAPAPAYAVERSWSMVQKTENLFLWKTEPDIFEYRQFMAADDFRMSVEQWADQGMATSWITHEYEECLDIVIRITVFYRPV